MGIIGNKNGVEKKSQFKRRPQVTQLMKFTFLSLKT